MSELQQLREWAGQINSIANGYKNASILYTAFNAAVFELLETPTTATDVAAALKWSERGTAMLLDGLLALGLVNKADNRYQNREAASACLVRSGKAYQGHILRHNQNSWEDWRQLEERVRTGTCAGKGENRSGEALRSFIMGMRDIATLSAREVLRAMDLSKYKNMLDLAGGPASYSIAFLQTFREMRATLLDKPEVVEIAKEQVLAAGLQDRFAYIAGDCMVEPLGCGYDLVFMSNIIHSFSARENAELVKKVYDALVPGGTIVIKDFIMENDRSGPAYGLIFALHMLVHTPAGGTYTFDEVKGWTDAAGFAMGRSIPLTPQTRLWIADKP
ncbi:MAG TPA: methyltransferase domain-containing protein [Candidatus Hydrogenedentes bacterium]|nr:methyltransferase domain-containing protein [Candidatus Hydrogenedentota bacterium]